MEYTRHALVALAALLGIMGVLPVEVAGQKGAGRAEQASEISVPSVPAPVEHVSGLKQRLLQMDALRAGAGTPFVALEKQGQELLQRYRRPAERAQIYFELAHVYAQSDIRLHPDRVAHYANLALTSETDPIQRSILFSYLGSAAEVDPTQLTFVAQRTKAAPFWLQGYQELLQLHLPISAPDRPRLDRFPDDMTDPARRQAFLRTHDAQMKAIAEVERLEKLIQIRDVFVRHLKEIYAREPRADAEIKQLTARILGDKPAAETLLAQILPQ